MVVRSARHQTQAAIGHALTHCSGVLHHMVDVFLESRLQGLAEGNGLASDNMHERAALATREHGRIDLLEQVLIVREDEAAARTTKGLMAGGRDDVRIRNRGRMRARGNQAGDMGHVDHKVCADFMRDLRHTLEVDDARIGRGAADDKLRLMLFRQLLHLVVIDGLGFGINAIRNDVVQLAGEVRRAAMGQVAAVIQAHAHNRITRLHRGEICGEVGICTGVRLDVRKLCTVQLASALACKVLDDINLLATAVIALARQAFGVLVRKNAAHGFHHGLRREVLGCDQLDGRTLTRQLLPKRACHFRIGLLHMIDSHEDTLPID